MRSIIEGDVVNTILGVGIVCRRYEWLDIGIVLNVDHLGRTNIPKYWNYLESAVVLVEGVEADNIKVLYGE